MDCLNWNMFLAYALQDLISHEITMNFVAANKIFFEGDGCEGCFDNNLKQIDIASQYEGWKDIFVHEYCHFLQWKDGSFVDLTTEEVKLDRWYQHKLELTPDEALEITKKVRDCELDCEKRTVEVIKQWNLPIDIPSYIQAANAYVLCYNVCLKKRAWIEKGVYTVTELINMMPTTWLDDYDNTPPEFEKIALVKCF